MIAQGTIIVAKVTRKSPAFVIASKRYFTCKRRLKGTER